MPTEHSATKAQDYAVIGGGLLGMTIAYNLSKAGCPVTLYEAAPDCGGLAAAWQIGDIIWDRHYHVTLLSDGFLRTLLRELGLDSQMRWKKTQTAFYRDGAFLRFSSTFDFLKFPLLSPLEKVRLAFTIERAARLKDWRSIEPLTIEQWLVQLSGPSVFRKIWQPLLQAKLGDDYQSTSATFLWATIQRMYAARRSGLKEEMFGYLPGGYQTLLTAFASALKSTGVIVKTNSPIRSIRPSGGDKLCIHTQAGEKSIFSNAVLTVPSVSASEMCPDLRMQEHAALRNVQYLGIICASVLLRRPISEYYITYLLDRQVNFTGLIDMSALVDSTELKGHGLLYIPRYLPPQHPDFELKDELLKLHTLSKLRKIYPAIQEDDILAFRISKVRHVFPRPTVGYSKSIPAIDTSIAGLSIVNACHITNGTLNANETIALGRRESLRIHAFNSSHRN